MSMIKAIYLFFGMLFFLEGSLSALLPPLWEGVAELKSILNDKQLGTYLQSGEVLEQIKNEENGWQIVTNKSKWLVKVIPETQNHPGPLKYSLEFVKLD